MKLRELFLGVAIASGPAMVASPAAAATVTYNFTGADISGFIDVDPTDLNPALDAGHYNIVGWSFTFDSQTFTGGATGTVDVNPNVSPAMVFFNNLFYFGDIDPYPGTERRNLGGYFSLSAPITDALPLNLASVIYGRNQYLDTYVYAQSGAGLFLSGQSFGSAPFSSITVSTPSAVPEPATWATMVVGFGIAGTAIRRRKARRDPAIA